MDGEKRMQGRDEEEGGKDFCPTLEVKRPL
jgi:hypothetical protein